VAQAVVGLGNPGAKYQGTRHNIGHQVLDRVAGLLQDEGSLLTGFRPVPGLGAIAEGICGTDAVFLFKPARYMNESGRAVARFLREYERYALAPADLILVYDDIDLPVGKVRTRMKGSHGGHKGVASVMESLGTQALRRVKVGIGRPSTKDEVVDHVLSRFAPEERSLIDAACTEAAEEVLKLLKADVWRPS
jgi:PTH1 family peptidyl-tRNA hydrolase